MQTYSRSSCCLSLIFQRKSLATGNAFFRQLTRKIPLRRLTDHRNGQRSRYAYDPIDRSQHWLSAYDKWAGTHLALHESLDPNGFCKTRNESWRWWSNEHSRASVRVQRQRTYVPIGKWARTPGSSIYPHLLLSAELCATAQLMVQEKSEHFFASQFIAYMTRAAEKVLCDAFQIGYESGSAGVRTVSIISPKAYWRRWLT